MTRRQRAQQKLGNALRFAYRHGLVKFTPAGVRIGEPANQAQRDLLPRLLKAFQRLHYPARAH